MTERRPLVDIAGDIKELPAGDTLPGSADTTPTADLFWFGDGSDGDATYSSGTVTLARDTYYRNLTLSGSVIFDPGGHRIYVSKVLDIRGLSTGYIGRVIGVGLDGTATAGGAAPTPGSLAGTTVGSNCNAVVNPGGAGGTNAAGTQATLLTSAVVPVAGGATSGSGGAGGNGSSTAGGARSFDPTALATLILARPGRPLPELMRAAALIVSSRSHGQGGSGGGGDGTNRGGGGGSGGVAAGPVAIFARTILRDGTTGPGTIRATGSKGGNGFTPTAGNCGGGGGGAGGPGGWVNIVYRFVTGAVAPGAIDVSGGNGGNGGSGIGTGTAGKGAGAGWGGFISLFNINDGSSARLAAPSSNTDPTGQTGETATLYRMDL